MASMEGRVIKVLYTEPSSKYFIFSFEIFEQKSSFGDAPNGAIRIDKNKKIAIIKGNFPRGVIEQQIYRVQGEWQSRISNGETQWSLLATKNEIVRENSLQSLQSYLICQPGIGPKLANAIIQMFGVNTMRALLKPEELVRVKGISKEKAQVIAKNHRNFAKTLRISEGLSRIGIYDFRVSMKIEEFYDDASEDIILNHPYKLYEDGIVSFKIADTIAMAREKKYEANDEARLRAAFLFALREVATSGDCCIKTKDLILKMESLLVTSKHSACKDALSEGAVIAALSNMLKENLIYREKVGEDIYCFLPSLYHAEKTSAKLLRGLASPTDDCIDNEEQFIANLEKEFGINYDERQKDAMRALGKSSLVIVTGGPGTGKTTVTRGVIRYRQEQKPDCKILCLAPTGRAAQRMTEATGLPAATIHRGLEVEGGMNGLMNFRKNEENQLDYDTVIVDEFSMVDILLLEALLKAIKPGTKVVFIGDKDQLPSVGPGCVLKDLIGCGKLPVVTLNLVFRQGKTSLIALNSKAIRDGELEAITCDQYEFVFIKRIGHEATAKACAQLFEKGMAKYGDANAVQILTPVRVVNPDKPNNTCCDLLNPVLREIANPANANKPERKIGKNVFRVGDKVMQFANNYDKNIMNGDSGYVTYIDNDCGTITVRFGDRNVEYENDEINQIGLCYATTIHKSQGSEYPMVIMPLCEDQGLQMLTRNLVYTGVTRAKKVIYIVGEPKAFEYAIRNLNIETRKTTLKERI